MRRVRTQSSARSYRVLKGARKSMRDVINQRLPPRTVEHIRHAHMLKGIREIARVGWQPWEPAVAEALRNMEKQRFLRANRYYSAVDRIQGLLDAVRTRGHQLEHTANALEETSTYLQALMNAMADCVITTDVAGAITDINPAMERLSGYRQGDVITRPFESLFTDTARAWEGIRRVLAEGQLANYDLELRTRDGQAVPISFNAAVLRDAAGAVVGVVGNARDVTQIREASRALSRHAAELRRSNEELEQFAYVASHDLQEPLRKIQTFGDQLAEIASTTIGQEGRDYLARMQAASERMRTLIRDLLSFSRITTRTEPFVPVPLGDIMQEVLTDLEVLVRSTGGTVHAADLPTVEADATQIRQLLQNLLSNALKFHRPDVAPVVRVRGEVLPEGRGLGLAEHHVGPACRITVEDNGIGFDEKYVDRIFTVFQRLHGHSQYEGTGIGLAICRKIVQRHGGSITARSRVGAGSTFIVVLPLRQGPEVTLGDAGGNENGAEG